jgi:hypothetical protein
MERQKPPKKCSVLGTKNKKKKPPTAKGGKKPPFAPAEQEEKEKPPIALHGRAEKNAAKTKQAKPRKVQ